LLIGFRQALTASAAISCILATCIPGGIARAAPHQLLSTHVPAAASPDRLVGALPPTQRLHVAVTLPMHNLTLLEGLLRDLQDPLSPSYRHYLSVEEFTRRFGPTAAEYAKLHDFARAHGLAVTAEHANRYVLDLEAPVATMEAAFNVHMRLYRHPDGTRLFFAPDREPMVDAGTPVLHISGLDNYELPTPRSRPDIAHANVVQHVGTGPGSSYTATDMRNAYYGGTQLTGAGQTLGLVEFIGYNPVDVQNYFTNLGQALTVPVVGISVDGTSVSCTSPCDDFEPSIDIEQAIGMAPGLKQVSFYIGGTVIDILNRIASDNTAKQISSSYGWGAEATVEDPVYMEFAAQGQSFVDGSGDMGYKLLQGGVWPADDAYVTGVGGSELSIQVPGGRWLTETGWPLSGGGPSPDNTKIPAWQKAFVNAANKAAPKRRNVPDVAAEANYDNFVCYDLGCASNGGGTSFAAPRWAGFIALVNQQAAALQKPTVGFLNTLLYKLAGTAAYNTDFHDITSGFNGKYNAVTGYDMVTGLGSPQPALINALVGP